MDHRCCHRLSGRCQAQCAGLLHQTMFPWRYHSTVRAQGLVIRLSGSCLHDSAGLLHQAMDPWRCHNIVMELSSCCHAEAVFMTVQDYCIRPWTLVTITALSQHCREAVIMLSCRGCLHDSAGLLHQAMDPRRCHNIVMELSSCCHAEAVFMTVQDYCIRPWTHGAVTILSWSCHSAVMQRLSS